MISASSSSPPPTTLSSSTSMDLHLHPLHPRNFLRKVRGGVVILVYLLASLVGSEFQAMRPVVYQLASSMDATTTTMTAASNNRTTTTTIATPPNMTSTHNHRQPNNGAGMHPTATTMILDHSNNSSSIRLPLSVNNKLNISTAPRSGSSTDEQWTEDAATISNEQDNQRDKAADGGGDDDGGSTHPQVVGYRNNLQWKSGQAGQGLIQPEEEPLITSSLITTKNNLNNSSSGHNRSQSTTQLEQEDDVDDDDDDDEASYDESWLYSIQLGAFLGAGWASITYEAILPTVHDHDDDKPQNHLPPPSVRRKIYNNKSYVVKITGDINKFGDKDGRTIQDMQFLADELIGSLAPHPSFPQTIHYTELNHNPFRTGLWPIPSSLADDDKDNNTSNASSSLSTHEEDARKRLFRCNKMFVSIEERAIETHPIVNDKEDEKRIMIVPQSKIYCFWRRLFEILDYVHSKRIRIIDCGLQNFILQHGELLMIDLHNGLHMEEPFNNTNNDQNMSHNNNMLLPFRHEFLKDGEHVHSHDVRNVGHHIAKRYLVPRFRPTSTSSSNGVGAGTEVWDDDAQRLQRMIEEQMIRGGIASGDREPASFGWLLQHDAYFTNHTQRNEICSLDW